MLMCFANCISPQFAPGQPGVGRGSGCLQLEPPEVAGSSEPGGGGVLSTHRLTSHPLTWWTLLS